MVKDKDLRRAYQKTELKRLLLTYRKQSTKDLGPWILNLQLEKLAKKSSRVKIKNRCTHTNRPKGVSSYFGLSRIAFRTLASGGLVNGVKKASW
jgi:ribosomal protein S14